MADTKRMVFSFNDLTNESQLVRELQKEFIKLGVQVSGVDVPTTVKRTAGISYREVLITFADSQVVTFKVKKTGDIFEVKLNKKTLPIRNQDNQIAAIKEIADAMDKGRAAFQRKLAAAKVEVPQGSRVSSKTSEAKQTDKITALKEAIAEAKRQIEELNQKTVEANQETASINEQNAAILQQIEELKAWINQRK